LVVQASSQIAGLTVNTLQLPDLEPPEEDEKESFKFVILCVCRPCPDERVADSRTLKKYRHRCSNYQVSTLAIPQTRFFSRVSISTSAWILELPWWVQTEQESRRCEDSRFCFVSEDADVYVRIKLLTGELNPLSGELKKNGRLRMSGSRSLCIL